MPTNLKKIQIIYLGSCDEKNLIFLDLKRWLIDKGVDNKQQICPALIDQVHEK